MAIWWKKRVKGSVLLLSLVVSMLILSLILFLLPLNNFLFKFYGHLTQRRQLYSNINSTLYLYLANPNSGGQFSPETNEFFENTKLDYERWGLFELLNISSKNESNHKQFTYLVGQNFFRATDSLVLYVPQTNSSLVCVGSSIVEGRIRVSKQGIKPGYIDGSFFSGSIKDMVTAGNSSATLPTTGYFFSEYLKSLVTPGNLAKEHFTSITPYQLLGDSVSVSFSQQPLLFFSDEGIELQNIFIKGKVLIYSNRRIVVNASSTIADAILVAPVIRIRDGFKGSAQLFASDSAIIEGNVSLMYPSVVSISQSRRDKSSIIDVGAGSLIDGSIISTRPNGIPNYFFPKVTLDKRSRVRGMVYIQGLTDAQGIIEGSVLTEYFFCESQSGFYLNYLRNGKLLYSSVPYEYAIPFIFSNKWEKCLVKRLD